MRMCSRIIHEECGKFSGLAATQFRRKIFDDILKFGVRPTAGNQVSQILAQVLLVIFRHEASATPV